LKILLYIFGNVRKRKLKIMAVPKKRTSKTKRNQRKANWKRKSYFAAQKSLSLAKSMLRGKPTSFVYSLDVEEE
jgi:large subunit ribosomal protein L32